MSCFSVRTVCLLTWPPLLGNISSLTSDESSRSSFPWEPPRFPSSEITTYTNAYLIRIVLRIYIVVTIVSIEPPTWYYSNAYPVIIFVYVGSISWLPVLGSGWYVESSSHGSCAHYWLSTLSRSTCCYGNDFHIIRVKRHQLKPS